MLYCDPKGVITMPMDGIPQPEIIDVNEAIRLRKYDGMHGFAFEWYQDTETVYLVDGVREPYSHETLDAMYHYLDQRGEMYFIEQRRGDVFVPIGDVCFSDQDMPIVIGDRTCRGQGIGKQVVSALIARGKSLGFSALRVREIYRWNEDSRRLFEGLGFTADGETEHGNSYTLSLV